MSKYRRKLSWLYWLWMTTRIKHLYVHVPFCSSICYYCDFCHRIYDKKLAKQWLETLKKEIQTSCFDFYETIYIGGGTPTVLSLDQLRRLLEMISEFADEVKEYTIEVNPESLDEDKILLFKEYGINRISMGVQSSNDRILSSLNRKHSFADVKDKIVLLKKHDLNNISVDLMYSLPDQTMEILDQSIEDILSLDVPHISLYSLTIEENSVFGKKGISNLDEETEADMYEFIEKKLTKNGYIHYEVSNYCKKGYESKHNMGYWNYEDFVGVSLGASGKIGNHRYTNTRDFKKYFTLKDYRDEDLYLEKEEMEFEHIMMSLRTIYGLNIQKFNALYGCDLQEKYKKGIASDHIEIKDGHLICTDLEILDTILLDFMLYR